MFNNKAKSKMDLQTADTILQNVFKACDVEPNNISIEKLEEKVASNHKKDNILIIITAVILLISILIPLILKFVLIPSAGTLSAPTLAVASHDMTTEAFTLSLDGPSVDFAATYAETNDGVRILPIGYDRSTNTLTFPCITEEANIFIYDVNGKYLHLLISPHN